MAEKKHKINNKEEKISTDGSLCTDSIFSNTACMHIIVFIMIKTKFCGNYQCINGYIAMNIDYIANTIKAVGMQVVCTQFP